MKDETPSGPDLERLCRKHGIKKLSLFGSGLARKMGPQSDVDLLVEFETGRTPGLFGLAQVAEELSALFEGRTIDLRSPRDLSRHFRDEVVAGAEVLFAA